MSTLLRLFGAAAVVGIVAPVADAQQPAPRPTGAHGVIVGVASDSINGRPLAGAHIFVVGTTRGGVTNERGAFRIDSVPPGRYRLQLLHPILDTIRLSVVTPELPMVAGDTLTVEVATPAPETVARAKCGDAVTGGSAALVGMVLDADDEAAVDSATVIVAWTETNVGTTVGLRRVPRQRVATTRADGSFRICGLPSGLEAELVAFRGRDTTAVLPLRFDHPALAVRTLILPSDSDEIAPDSSAAAPSRTAAARGAPVLRRGRATVRGRVTTVGGAPVAGARVAVLGAAGTALTNERGEFTLAEQPSGSQTVLVRRLGYQPSEMAVNLSAARPAEVNVTLGEFVPVLETITVRGRRDAALERVGFTQRQRSGRGRYLAAEDIERRNALNLVDVLADMPMLRSVRAGAGNERMIVGRSRGTGYGCVQYYVDGFPWTGSGAPTEFMIPAEVGAIEVYSATMTPGEFTRSNQECETVVIWTKSRLGMR